MKPGSAPTIQVLKEANIRCAMVTGVFCCQLCMVYANRTMSFYVLYTNKIEIEVMNALLESELM